MDSTITAVCLSLASAMPLVWANEKHQTRPELMDLRGPQTEFTPQQQAGIEPGTEPGTRPVPEPNILVALAFAGVVILTRHRFRS